MSTFFSRNGAALVLLLAACSGSDPSTPSAEDGGPAADAGGVDANDASNGIDAARDAGDAGLGVACTGAKPSFAKDVEPIFQRSCGGGELCHSGTAVSPWTYANLVNVPSTRDCASAGNRVTPSSLDASYVMHKLTGIGMCAGTERMPRGEPPLPGAQIQTIADWICSGAPNN